MRRPQFTIRALLVAMLAAACFFGGIHFEQHRKAVPRGVQTIYVRMAKVTKLPADRGKQLAEAVCLRIETVTPYKAVTVPSEADSELVCTVSADRQTQNVGELTVKWVDSNGVGLQSPYRFAFPLSELWDERAIHHLAEEIAAMVEAPW
ncbi:MAG TPA: hypothetical protein VG125_14860 [Pirellulales bacterium]|jgi:hypothetical protein|nr:hypothetical protein [Pirellulales bacterium]